MAYFDKVFEEYFNVLAQEDGLERLIDQRETMIASLGMDFIAYGEHFQDADQLTISVADSSNHNDLSESYALTWDDTTQQWRMVTEFDVSTHPGGIWVSPDTYHEVMKLVEQYPLVENTAYFDNATGQSYIFCAAEFLPNLPQDYTWYALKNYLQPAPRVGYENGGSLWTLSKITTASTDLSENANINENNVQNGSNVLLLSDIIDFSNDSLNQYLNTLHNQDISDFHHLASVETQSQVPSHLNWYSASMYEAPIESMGIC